VLTDTSRITAVGTAFSIDISSANDTEVLVIEGRVKVDRLSSALASAKNEIKTARTQQKSPVYLNKGQQVLMNYNAAKVSYNDDIDAALAWREGRIIFSGESLAVAVREIDRYIPLDFEIVDQQIASIPVGGFFKTGDLDQLLLIFEQNFGVVSERKGNKILLSKAK
jgi:transmembrane sensor